MVMEPIKKTPGDDKRPEEKQKIPVETVVLLDDSLVSGDKLSEHNVTTTQPNDTIRSFCTRCFSCLENSYQSGRCFLSSKLPLLKKILKAILVFLWIVYLICSFVIGGTNAIPLALITLIASLGALWKYTKGRCVKRIAKTVRRTKKLVCAKKALKWSKRIFCLALLACFVVIIVMDASRNTENLASLGGLILCLLFVFLTSTNPFKVNWQPVLWGLAVQFVFALVILRWDTGYRAFTFLGDQVKVFLEYSDAGAKFVFDKDHYIKHRFVFRLESSVMLRPFLSKLTLSELHAVMATGFATIAGTVIAAFIDFGAAPEHLLAASFMSGPAALALAKLGFPETETSLTKTVQDVRLPKGTERNVIEAASVGAANAVKLVAYIVVNVLAFLAILEFVNAVLAYLGQNVGVDGLSFQLICSYLFAPLAAVMGIPWADTAKVGELIGTKIFINEFVGYSQLGPMIKAGEVQRRTGVIATYILCGFSSIQSMGITLGVFSAVAPDRRRDVAGHMIRALVIGNIACFTTACIAGILYNEHGLELPVSLSNATSLNLTATTLNLTASTASSGITALP